MHMSAFRINHKLKSKSNLNSFQIIFSIIQPQLFEKKIMKIERNNSERIALAEKKIINKINRPPLAIPNSIKNMRRHFCFLSHLSTN